MIGSGKNMHHLLRTIAQALYTTMDFLALRFDSTIRANVKRAGLLTSVFYKLSEYMIRVRTV